jgi:hypothetical protein
MTLDAWFAIMCVASTPVIFLLVRRLTEGPHARRHVTDRYYDARADVEYRCETTDQLPLGADDGTLVWVGDVEYVYCGGDDVWKQTSPSPPDVSWIEFDRRRR